MKGETAHLRPQLGLPGFAAGRFLDRMGLRLLRLALGRSLVPCRLHDFPLGLQGTAVGSFAKCGHEGVRQAFAIEPVDAELDGTRHDRASIRSSRRGSSLASSFAAISSSAPSQSV